MIVKLPQFLARLKASECEQCNGKDQRLHGRLSAKTDLVAAHRPDKNTGARTTLSRLASALLIAANDPCD